jgi:hypothetical protein
VTVPPVPGIIWVRYEQSKVMHLWAMMTQIFLPTLMR